MGDKASAEKTLAALAALPDSTDKGFMPRVKAALEAVKAGTQWPVK